MAATYKPFKVAIEAEVRVDRGAQPSNEEVESALADYLGGGGSIHISVDLPKGGFEGGRILVIDPKVKAEVIE